MAAVRYTKDARDHALRALNAFAAAPRWAAVRLAATARYYAGLPEDATAHERDVSMRHANVRDCHAAYGLADYLTAGTPAIAADFLESKRVLLLPRGARVWLEEFVHSAVSAYQVRGAVPGSHLILRDLLTGELCEVHERLGSQDCKPGFTIAARVMPRGDGKLGFHGDTLILPGPAQALEESLHQWFHEELRLLPTDANLFAFRKTLAPFFFECWFRLSFRTARTVPVRVNGEVAEPGVGIFVMPADVSAEDAFAQVSGLEAEGDGVWTYRPEHGGKRYLRGRYFVRGRWLRIESLGRASMKQMRVVAQGVFGGRLRHHSTRYLPPLLGSNEAGASYDLDHVPLDLAEVGVPPEHPEFQERVRAMQIAKHYATWAQVPLPALDGRTPAAAAADPATRARVLALIEDMEQREREDAERRGPGARAFDFGPLRRELDFGAPQADLSLE